LAAAGSMPIAGYQKGKTTRSGSIFPLLDWNIKDYPNNDTHFESFYLTKFILQEPWLGFAYCKHQMISPVDL